MGAAAGVGAGHRVCCWAGFTWELAHRPRYILQELQRWVALTHPCTTGDLLAQEGFCPSARTLAWVWVCGGGSDQGSWGRTWCRSQGTKWLWAGWTPTAAKWQEPSPGMEITLREYGKVGYEREASWSSLSTPWKNLCTINNERGI